MDVRRESLSFLRRLESEGVIWCGVGRVVVIVDQKVEEKEVSRLLSSGLLPVGVDEDWPHGMVVWWMPPVWGWGGGKNAGRLQYHKALTADCFGELGPPPRFGDRRCMVCY